MVSPNPDVLRIRPARDLPKYLQGARASRRRMVDQQNTLQLEERIRQRTAALQRANEALKSEIAERKQVEAALQYRVAFEGLITRISSHFINAPLEEVDSGISRALATLGEFVDVDRSYLFLYSSDGRFMDNTHEWCRPDIAPQIDYLQHIHTEHLAWSNEILRQGEVLHIPRVSDLPPEAAAERVEFERQGNRSIIAVPMVYRGRTIGFLGFDSVLSEKTWSEDSITLLKIVGEIFVNALEHKRAQAIQAGLRQFLELLATGGTFHETLRALVQAIEEQSPGMLGLILLLDEDGRQLHVGAANRLPQKYLDSIEGLEIGPEVGSCGTASYLKQRVIVEDIATDPRWDGLRELAVEYGLGACWSEPVVDTSGQVLGTFAMYYRQKRSPTEAELRTIETAAHLVGVAIEQKQAREALQAAYQTLEDRVARRTEEIEQRNRELEALYRADEELYRHLDIDQVLRTLVDVAVDLLQADKSAIMVWDDDQTHLIVQAEHGFGKETLLPGVLSAKNTLAGHVAATGAPAIVEDTLTDDRVARHITDPESIRSFMHVPIQIGDQIYGVYNVDYLEPRAFGEQEQRLFMALAHRAALAIQNARLYEQAQYAAAAEERNRLARELHDAVTQTLFSASLIADVLPRIWKRNPEAGQAQLAELRELTRGALAEMRTLLLELRPATLTEVSLEELLRQLTDATIGRSRLKIDLKIEGEPALPPDVQVALYRIAQESLNNIAKHAEANRAQIHLRVTATTVELRITDDGRGFDARNVPISSLGLGIMRERAARIGAAVDIQSQLGAGTTVTAIWPVTPNAA
jgi:signal transduction histidine kinase